MSNSKLLVAIAIVLVGGIYYKNFYRTKASVVFRNEVYVEHTYKKNGPVYVTVFTPEGSKFSASSNQLQIIGFGPETPEPHKKIMTTQVFNQLSLVAIKGSTDQYFTMQLNEIPIYGLIKDNGLIIFIRLRGFQGNEQQLRESSKDIFKSMDEVKI